MDPRRFWTDAVVICHRILSPKAVHDNARIKVYTSDALGIITHDNSWFCFSTTASSSELVMELMWNFHSEIEVKIEIMSLLRLVYFS
jgi:hypothetical protein